MVRDTIQLETAVSTISQEYLLEFTSEYGITEDLHPELPGLGDRIVDFSEGKVGVYTKFFEFANFRIPVSQFLFDILGHYQIHLSQLSVIGAAKVSHFEINSNVQEKTPRGVMPFECGFTQILNDHSFFVKSSNKTFIALLVYVDDTMISENDLNEINMVKSFLSSKFQIKDLGKLKYFLGIEALEFSNDICHSQRKYYIGLLHEFGMLGSKPTSVHVEPNIVLNFKVSKDDPTLDNIIDY
ncbi:gypsy type transposase [Tanacetum coccineum]